MSNIKVNTTTYSSGANFDARTTTARCGDSVTLTSESGTDINVYTTPADAFGAHSTPYYASTGGQTYKLKPKFVGTITLSLSDGTSVVGTNGTINVGGGGGGCAPPSSEDGERGGDDDGHHHHGSRA